MTLDKKQPLVSIGIPTYNRPEGLRKTLECMTNQTYKKLEIIVSDNCSPGEETQNIMKEFADRDSRVKVYRQDANRGAVFNFRFVLDSSQGRYFMWAADDDYWDKKFIETGVETLLADSFYQAWFCSLDQIDNQGHTILEPPSLSRFSSTPNKRTDIVKYLRAPRIMMKDCITYSIFERDTLLNIANYLFNNPGGNCSEFRTAFLTRYNIAISSDILFHKSISSRSLQKMLNEGIALTKYSHRGKNLYGGEFALKRAPSHIRQEYLAAKGTGYAGTVLLTLIAMLPASIAAYVASRVIRKIRSVTKRINGLMRHLK